MCVKLSSSGIRPGEQLLIAMRGGDTTFMTWGFNNGHTYNARFEGLATTWKKYNMNRGIIKMKSFWEGKKEFFHKDGKFFLMGALHSANKEECAIITVNANIVIKPYHHRMPLILDEGNAEEFLQGSMTPKLLDESSYIIQELTAA